VSGAGKTTFCDLIQGPKVVCCADDFYYDDKGNYNWNASLIGRAHENCRHKFDWALKDDVVDNIIIANTNTKPSDWKYYEDEALEAGLRVVFVILEHRHNGVNQHSVPQEALERQANTIKQNLKLL
jgi:hypothetical protein